MREPKDITITFDMDGVICENNNGDYANASPYLHSIEAINTTYNLGYHIIICTARYGQRFPGKQYQKGYEEALKWLRDHGVKFHELYMGKPPGDMYVDDKGCTVDAKYGPLVWKEYWKQLELLSKKNQYNQPISLSDDIDSYNYGHGLDK